MRCLPCRINRRRLWGSRLALESLLHPASVFVTLTLSEDYATSKTRSEVLAKDPGRPDSRSVSVRESQLWLKRVREWFPPQSVRYFIVGEYGGLSWRPHYHAVLFGPEGLRSGGWLESSWPHGHVMCGFAEPGAISYVTGYATKGLTRVHEKLAGRRPEFCRMSLRPGLGAGALDEIARWCVSKAGADFIARTGDVPRSLRIGGRVVPLGRYLVGRLRELVGVDPGDLGFKYSETCYLEVMQVGREKRESQARQSGRIARARLQIQTSMRQL